jgi:hypothetical protein
MRRSLMVLTAVLALAGTAPESQAADRVQAALNAGSNSTEVAMPRETQPGPGSGDAVNVRTATFVVAAAGSPDHLKAQADFVCSGLDDHLVINSAIASLPEGGGRVHLSAGTYSIGGVEGTYGGISILRSNVLLTGEGSGTRLILQDGLTDINVIWIRGTIEDITIRDLFIDGNGKNQVPWVRARAGWNGGNGIKAIDKKVLGPTPRNVKVENCHIENCQLMAAMLHGEAVEVRNCYFTGSFGSHVIELLGESRRIQDCTLRVRDGDSVAYGFSTDASYYYHIVDNQILVDAGGTIRGNPINNWPPKQYGDGTTPNEYHGIISGNMVVNRGKSGSILLRGYMDLVHHNMFRGVPVQIAGMGLLFDHNMLIDSALEIDSPHRDDGCFTYISGNVLTNSVVTHKQGKVVWGTNPGHPAGDLEQQP